MSAEAQWCGDACKWEKARGTSYYHSPTNRPSFGSDTPAAQLLSLVFGLSLFHTVFVFVCACVCMCAYVCGLSWLIQLLNIESKGSDLRPKLRDNKTFCGLREGPLLRPRHILRLRTRLQHRGQLYCSAGFVSSILSLLVNVSAFYTVKVNLLAQWEVNRSTLIT